MANPEKMKEIHTPGELRDVYPLGMLIYYQPDATPAGRVQNILQKTFPNHLVYASGGHILYWPQDTGIQLGPYLYTNREAIIYALEGLRTCTQMPMGQYFPKEWYLLIPEDIRDDLQGGYTVSIPRSHTVAYIGDFSPAEDPKAFFKSTGIHMIRMKEIELALRMAAKTEKAWIYGNPDGVQHVDCVLTGFSQQKGFNLAIQWYIDEVVAQYVHLDATMKRFPHDLALRGGLNIQYMHNGHEWIALVPSLSAIGPLAKDLPAAGYRIVQLGEDQVRNDGGVKCRTLELHWRV